MMSKSASAAFADGGAFRSRSRASSAALDGHGEAPDPIGVAVPRRLSPTTRPAASSAASADRDRANALNDSLRSVSLKRHRLQRGDPRRHRRMRREQIGPERLP